MKTYKKTYTAKFPFQYTIELDFYLIHTCDENKHNSAVSQIIEKGYTSLTTAQIVKLEMNGFTVIRKPV